MSKVRTSYLKDGLTPVELAACGLDHLSAAGSLFLNFSTLTLPQSHHVFVTLELPMERLISIVVSSVVLIALSGLAGGADTPNSDQSKPQADRAVGNSSQQEADYLAAVKKCEGMEPKVKQNCIESAKERFGEMLR